VAPEYVDKNREHQPDLDHEEKEPQQVVRDLTGPIGRRKQSHAVILAPRRRSSERRSV
jgi:hypothetical protein